MKFMSDDLNLQQNPKGHWTPALTEPMWQRANLTIAYMVPFAIFPISCSLSRSCSSKERGDFIFSILVMHTYCKAKPMHKEKTIGQSVPCACVSWCPGQRGDVFSLICEHFCFWGHIWCVYGPGRMRWVIS